VVVLAAVTAALAAGTAAVQPPAAAGLALPPVVTASAATAHAAAAVPHAKRVPCPGSAFGRAKPGLQEGTGQGFAISFSFRRTAQNPASVKRQG
jgi:hypothetical protein